MTEIIGVRFRGGPKEYYFDPRGMKAEPGQFVIVETAQGPEYARCVTGNREVEDERVVQPLRPLLRLADESDAATWEQNRRREKSAFGICQQKIASHRLDMKLVRCDLNFDGSKLIFYFTSEGRVDFRALVRDLAAEFRTRIELRQIGVRDEAKLLGGIGICGRPFCCAEFLDDFIPVSIKMAKTQNLSLNPGKISGACGRLMCCLKYEQDAYVDAAQRCPRAESFVLTPDGPGNITGVDVLRETVTVRLDDAPEAPKRYRTCELNVLRSGKGSREGIEIPAQRPERYQPEPPEPPEEPFRLPELPAEPPEERRRRGGRNRKRPQEAAPPERPPAGGRSVPERGARPERGEKRKQPERPPHARRPKPEPGEQRPPRAPRPEAGEQRPPRRGRPRKGGYRRDGGKKTEE